MGGVEGALIVGLRIAQKHHREWALTLMAVFSAGLLSAGVLRHYWDIYVYRTVRGISFIFVGIDATGDLSSLISLCFQPTLDILGMVIYGSELLLWIGIIVCGGYFNFIPWMKKKLEESSLRKSATSQSRTESHPRAPSNALRNANSVDLNVLPSSISVFRTPSNEIATVRSRPGSQ
jgi:PQ loop repeat